MNTFELLEPRLCLSSNPTDFVDAIDNRYLPLIPGTTLIYRGADALGNALRQRVTVTGETRSIDGIDTTVVRERRYTNSSLSGDRYGFFAQDKSGNVWQFPAPDSAVDQPWIAVAAQSTAGKEIARVPFATFADCLKTESSVASGIDDSRQIYFAPGIGQVMSQSVKSGEYLRLAYVSLAPEAFDGAVDNQFYPLEPGTTRIYRGSDAGVPIRLRVNVTSETKLILGVATTVVRDRQYADGALSEDTTSYFAQDKAGNVWSFGEVGKKYDDGAVVSTEGSWQAGVDGAIATIFMRTQPAVGDFYHLGNLPGVAEDHAEIVATAQTVRAPFGTLRDCIRAVDTSPLESDDIEFKFYAPGLGLVMEHSIEGDESMRLAYVIVEPAD